MIDSASEALLTLSQAAETLPRRRAGRKAHVSTLFRWSTAGCRGVVLETIQVGGTRCTSREALQRFFERLTTPHVAGAGTGPSSAQRSTVRRRRDSEAGTAAEVESLRRVEGRADR